jgi:hypothetical protein
MFIALYIFLLLFIASLLEIVCGSYGIIIPLAAPVVFYISITFGAPAGFFSGALTGLVIDMLYGRSLIITPSLMILITVLALFWLYRMEAKSIFLHIIPGALIAFIYLIPIQLLALNNVGISLAGIFHDLSNLIFAVCVSAFFLPTLIIVLDMLNEDLGFELYRKAREKITERT